MVFNAGFWVESFKKQDNRDRNLSGISRSLQTLIKLTGPGIGRRTLAKLLRVDKRSIVPCIEGHHSQLSVKLWRGVFLSPPRAEGRKGSLVLS